MGYIGRNQSLHHLGLHSTTVNINIGLAKICPLAWTTNQFGLQWHVTITHSFIGCDLLVKVLIEQGPMSHSGLGNI
jgi:hypothetical protein